MTTRFEPLTSMDRRFRQKIYVPRFKDSSERRDKRATCRAVLTLDVGFITDVTGSPVYAESGSIVYNGKLRTVRRRNGSNVWILKSPAWAVDAMLARTH